MCQELDTVVEPFRTRQLADEYPYVWVDATYHKVRVDGRVVSQATAVAVGVTADGERHVLGVDAGASEDGAFWTAFLRSLVRRGLRGVRLVISDAHEGLKQATGKVLSGASWQRCRVHFMRDLLALVPHGAREAVAAVVRTIFAQPDHASALVQLEELRQRLRHQRSAIKRLRDSLKRSSRRFDSGRRLRTASTTAPNEPGGSRPPSAKRVST